MEILNEKTGDTLFHVIVMKGLRDTSIFCQSSSFTVEMLEVSNKNKQRPLHVAVGKRNPKLVELLLQKGASVDSLKRGDWTSLMIASAMAEKEAVDIVKILLYYGANCKLKNKDGWTCLHLASRVGNTAVVKTLLDKDKSLIWELSENGRLSLHIAALHSRTAVVEQLLMSNPPSANAAMCSAKDACGATPALEAASSGNWNILRIISSEVNITKQVDRGGMNCLHRAAQMGHESLVKQLVDCGFHVNQPTLNENLTPLHLAVLENHAETIMSLLHCGADVGKVNSSGQTALELPRGLEKNKLIDIIMKFSSK